MDSDWSPGEVHETFTEWALAQGVIANKVRPARFPGRGLGMIATDKIKVRRDLLEEKRGEAISPTASPRT